MKYTDTKLEEILNKLVASTRSPRGRFSATASYPELEKKLKSHTRRLTLIRTFSAAAAVALLCLSVWTAYLYMQPVTIQTVSTLAETRTVCLPDGSTVTLNHYSSLSYPEKFKSDKREVELNGEAYFEVARNTNCPFIVHTGIQNVRVLGTSFGITNYADDQNLTTTLVNGKVQVEFPGFSDEVFLLEPGFQLACDRQNRKIEKRTVDVYEYVAWKDGKYVFTRKRLEDILTTLSRWYDFHVFFQNPEVKEVVFSGELRRFDSFSDILRLIEKTSDVKFTTTGNTVLVRE